jgi:hypothetical protein
MHSIVDPLKEKVFFDAATIGSAILNPASSCYAHDVLKKTLNDPIVILEASAGRRIYILPTNRQELRIVNVVLKDSVWYAENIDIEKKSTDFMELIQKHTAIYKREF